MTPEEEGILPFTKCNNAYRFDPKISHIASPPSSFIP